jgi:hypothetical protein
VLAPVIPACSQERGVARGRTTKPGSADQRRSPDRRVQDVAGVEQVGHRGAGHGLDVGALDAAAALVDRAVAAGRGDQGLSALAAVLGGG